MSELPRVAPMPGQSRLGVASSSGQGFPYRLPLGYLGRTRGAYVPHTTEHYEARYGMACVA